MLTAGDWDAIRLSLWVSLWATLCGLPVSYTLAYVLARGRFRLKSMLDSLVMLPLVLPPVVVGFFLLLLLGREGPLGKWLYGWFGVTVIFRWTGAAIASGIMALPLAVRVIRVSIESVDRGLEGAARTLGAGRIRTFLTVTLPLTLPGILAGAVLSFARGLGEFGATITFVSNIPGQTRTLPIAIYSALQVPGGEGSAMHLTVIALIVAFVAIFLAEAASRRLRRDQA